MEKRKRAAVQRSVAKAKPDKRSRNGVVRGSGNAFRDLGVRQPEEKKSKVRLAMIINELIKESNLSQTQAAGLIGESQPKISALRNYRLSGFSIERLLQYINALGRDVEIVVSGKTRQSPSTRVRLEAA